MLSCQGCEVICVLLKSKECGRGYSTFYLVGRTNCKWCRSVTLGTTLVVILHACPSLVCISLPGKCCDFPFPIFAWTWKGFPIHTLPTLCCSGCTCFLCSWHESPSLVGEWEHVSTTWPKDCTSEMMHLRCAAARPFIVQHSVGQPLQSYRLLFSHGRLKVGGCPTFCAGFQRQFSSYLE